MTGPDTNPSGTNPSGTNPGQDPIQQLTQRLAELERGAESDRHALRSDLTALLSKVEQLAALDTGLTQTRTIVETINDDLDHIVHRLARLEAAAEERAASPRAGTPIVWHKLDPDLVAALWKSFTEWVVWLADTYALSVHQLPACWYLHGCVVHELTGLWTSWLSAHDRDKGDTGAAVYLWQDALGRALDRFSSKWLGQCVNGSHKPRDRTPWSQDPVYLSYFAHLPDNLRPAAPPPTSASADAMPAPPPPHPEGTAYDRH